MSSLLFMEMGNRAVMESCLAKRESSLALVSSFKPPCYIWHMACPHLSFFLLPSLSPFLVLSLLLLFLSLLLFHPSAVVERILSDLNLRNQTSLSLKICFAIYYCICELG